MADADQPHQDEVPHEGQLDLVPVDGDSAEAASTLICAYLQHLLGYDGLESSAVEVQPAFRLQARFQNVSTGMRIRYTEWGSGDEVIILLHDTAEAGMVWASLARRLADLGCRIIAPDMRGHGDSTWSQEQHYNCDALVLDLTSFILEKDLYKRPIGLVGIGLGAAVALAAAAQHPKLVGALVLIGFTPSLSPADLSFSAFQAACFKDSRAILNLMSAPCWGYDAWMTATAPLWLPHMIQNPGPGGSSTDASLKLKMDPRWFCNWQRLEPEQHPGTSLTPSSSGSQQPRQEVQPAASPVQPAASFTLGQSKMASSPPQPSAGLETGLQGKAAMQSVWEEQLSAVRAHLLVVRGGSCPRLSLEEARRMTIVASTAASTQVGRAQTPSSFSSPSLHSLERRGDG
ncbi:hypothetical protein WJX84_011737 [Apatococcus fuscideae]|uniref:AB hydrolase-1 domain-containing protein n=1 Tax=Apatococcus fuscideae TaxID=2026836 RepID=A0AAW1SI82_9CHLO